MKLSQIKALGPWMAEVRFVWMSLGVNLSVPFAALHLVGMEEKAILYAGLFLQLLGISAVVWGILRTRADFGHATIRSELKAWLQRCPLFTCVVAVEVANTGHASAATLLSIFEMQVAGQNPTQNMRLDAAEKNIVAMHKRITAMEERHVEKVNRVVADLRHEAEARESGDTTNQKQLEKTATGGLHISAFGSACLFVGVILSTLPNEITKWL